MAELFILIPGRTSRQGTSLNEGKYSSEYQDETGTLQMAVEDMRRLGLNEGDRVRLWNETGDVTVPCKPAPRDELPQGMLFISYGDVSCRLMGGETHCSGMPDSKGIDVYLEKA
jgi:formylmethanofuran dehydrogenase subunit D